jgi:hypothetical protein
MHVPRELYINCQVHCIYNKSSVSEYSIKVVRALSKLERAEAGGNAIVLG